jgi:B12-binding domain/radical SAM domain protein
MKPILCCRCANYNLVSFGALLGACSEELLAQFELRFWRAEAPPPLANGERVLVLFSFMMPHLSEVFSSLCQVRESAERNQEIAIWAGGPQATIAAEGVAAMGFDAVFVGEGERCFPQSLQQWLRGEKVGPMVTADEELLELDPFPGFHPAVGYLPPIEISRGCLFGCMFCAVPRLNRGRIRHRSVESIVEIAVRYREVKPERRRVKFLASNAFAYGSSDGRSPNLDALLRLLSGLRDAGIPAISLGSFPSEVRPDFVTREILDLVSPFLANRTIVMGIQHASERMLERLNRGHTVAQAEEAVRLLKEYGFTAHVDFIMALPGETAAEQEALLDFMEYLVETYQVRIHLHTFMPTPGSAWAHRRAGMISERSRERIKVLERQGVLDGWWENQIAYSRVEQGDWSR